MIFQKSKIILKRIQNNRGSALLTTYLIATLLLLLGAAFLIINITEKNTAEVQRKATQAFYIAEAGIEQAIYDLKQDFAADPTGPTWTDGVTIGATTYGPNTGAFYALYGGAVTFPAGAYTHAFSKTSTNSYVVSLMNVAGEDDIWVRSTGVVDGVTQTIELYLRMMNLSPWDNAIFGGAGASGTMVNGNVNIYGSVHILGNGLADGDDAINLGGTAELVGNNYNVGAQGLSVALKAKIPDLPTTVFNGETVDTLSAELRVKKGKVSLSGNSAVGQSDSTGNSVKETVDAAYVTDGYGGTKGTTNVFSDNGTSEGYDLGDELTFPTLNDPYPGNPAQNYYEYFTDNALLLTNELASVTPGSSFTLGNCATNCITSDGSGNLNINGIVYVTGNNDLGLSGGDFDYTGTGSILVSGNVSIDATVVTAGNNSFPTNILGIMTPNDIEIGSTSQEDVMGLFFAEGEIEVSKQTDLIGTIVTNYFDISSQVPSIFQVPDAAENLPPGMIAGDDFWFIKVVSWQKLD